ncbi:MAG: hypothetical protein OJI67_18075 [Prosthecobacter sp.]|nr:hypothetical protein [Prosthecobacter sp.]
MIFPLIFWLLLLLLAALVVEAALKWEEPWSKPAIALYGTVAAWYPGNLAYSGMLHFNELFSKTIINAALLQVIGFLVALRLFIFPVCKFLLRKAEKPPGVNLRSFASQIAPLFWSVFVLWLVLFSIAVFRLEGDILAVFWPPIAREKVILYAHSGMGGSTGFLVASAQYSYQMACAFFGVAFILSRGWLKSFSFIMICITWPYFMFDRNRNIQLAVAMPMLISYMLLGPAKVYFKVVLAVVFFAFFYIWFILVGSYRGDYDMSSFLQAPRLSSANLIKSRHSGLDMLEELCYINKFIENGTYKINHGERYLADVLNVVPRAIWKNKPLLGFDYAIARGFANPNARYGEVSISAIIATGMIGQGVVNFGRFFGVMAAALLASLWVGLLSRLWVERWKVGNAFLFILGLGLTFNLGREITLLVLWPFVFASFGVWIVHKFIKAPYQVNQRLARPRFRQ